MKIAKTLSIVVLSSLAINSYAQTVVLEQSHLKFTGKQMGTAFTGQFKKFNASIQFDPAQIASATAQIDIHLGSTALPSKEAETELKGANWFDVAKNPTAKFVTTSFKADGTNYVAIGKLTLKGITKILNVPFSAKKQENQWVFDGKIRINRGDFKLGQGMWADFETVSNEVDVNFHLTAK